MENPMQSEVTVTIKGEDSTFKKKFLCYEQLTLSQECMELNRMVDQTLSEFKGTPDEVIIKITAKWS